jgi:hypothetical protein
MDEDFGTAKKRYEERHQQTQPQPLLNKQKKMLLSSRANPPKPLKFGGDRDATDQRYLSIKGLLSRAPNTPIPSPSLPSILPRHGKKPPKLNSKKIVRGILWLSLIIGVYYLFAGRTTTRTKSNRGRLADLTFLTSLGKTYEIVEAAELPDHPTALAFDDAGRHFWTISIPHALRFPLPSTDYADICSQVEEVSRHVAGPKDNRRRVDRRPYGIDPRFVDVQEAQARHFLPAQPPPGSTNGQAPVCPTTLTYVLDATDAGLGSALLGMWLSYGLAQREGREFFVDDTDFAYGTYNTFFAPLSRPPCRPPPPSQRVPCPHHARHLVVSAATTGWIFGDEFHGRYSRREIFDMTRRGYEALFGLKKEDDDYVRNRAIKLRTATSPEEKKTGLVGVHIRRGDCHPYEFAYQRGYLPPDVYMTAARQFGFKVMLASDDADMYDHVELADTVRAQQRISLAGKKQLLGTDGGGGGLGWEGGFFKDVFWRLGLPPDVLHRQKRVGSPMPTRADGRPVEEANDDHHDHHDDDDDDDNDHKKVEKDSKAKHPPPGVYPSKRPKDEKQNQPPPLPSTTVDTFDMSRDYRTHPTKEALQFRELVGRAYLLDLAMLAQSDKVVCGVASNACRILAVMLGWERAFEQGDWINVDGNYGWRVLDY